MADEYNHAAHELTKLDDDADRYGIQLDSRYLNSSKTGGETRWMSLPPPPRPERSGGRTPDQFQPLTLHHRQGRLNP